MRKIIALLIGIILVYSCSTSSDGTTTAIPLPPTNLTGNVISTTQINLSWTDNSTNETSFKIERKSGTGTFAVVGTTATDMTTFKDTSLRSGTTYVYRVYSNNAVGNSPTYSNELTMTTDAVIPIVPTNLIGTVVSSTQINLSWTDNSTNETGFKIERKSGTGTFAVVGTTATNITTFSNTALTSGITYVYRVYSNNAAGNSLTYSNELTLTTASVIPIVPTNLIGTVVSSTQINLSWTDNSTNETGFKIERKSGTGTFAVVGTTATNITTFSNTALTSGTTYVYRVYSYNAAGNSLTYSNEVTLTSAPINSICDDTTTPYATVTIGTQVWMQKNLNVCKYRNGDEIPQVTNPTTWTNLKTGAWCYYENNTANGIVYGKLYNWYAVHDPRGLAPVGYHIPSDVEWTTLTTFLGGENVARGKMKSTTDWDTPNFGATNSSGFTALPGGYRGFNGAFRSISVYGFWWSSEDITSSNVCRLLYYDWRSINSNNTTEEGGYSVRCLKD